MIQLTRSGTVFSGSTEDLESLREQFDRHHCIRLPQLLEPGILKVIQERIDQTEFVERAHEGAGVELCMTENISAGLLHFLTNTPTLFRIIEHVTGCGQIGCFTGRVYRTTPGLGHYDVWHTDMMQDRMVGLSINLSTDVFSGGIFQLRKRKWKWIVYQVANTGFGDGILFRIVDHLEHRITTMKGAVPKTAFAGWFRSQPDFLSSLRATPTKEG